jgi:hypothetical protein
MKKNSGLGMLQEVRESFGPDGDGRDLYGLPDLTDGVHRNSCVVERVGFQLAVASGQISTGGDPRVASAAAEALAAIHAGIPSHTMITTVGWVKLDKFFSIRRGTALSVVRRSESAAA